VEEVAASLVREFLSRKVRGRPWKPGAAPVWGAAWALAPSWRAALARCLRTTAERPFSRGRGRRGHFRRGPARPPRLDPRGGLQRPTAIPARHPRHASHWKVFPSRGHGAHGSSSHASLSDILVSSETPSFLKENFVRFSYCLVPGEFGKCLQVEEDLSSCSPVAVDLGEGGVGGHGYGARGCNH
jgi:hypothetical protein